VLNSVAFEADGDATLVHLEVEPLDANDRQREAFAAILDSMQMGWGGSLGQLDVLLAESEGVA